MLHRQDCKAHANTSSQISIRGSLWNFYSRYSQRWSLLGSNLREDKGGWAGWLGGKMSVRIEEVASLTKSQRVATHTHIRGLGLGPDGRAAPLAAGKQPRNHVCVPTLMIQSIAATAALQDTSRCVTRDVIDCLPTRSRLTLQSVSEDWRGFCQKHKSWRTINLDPDEHQFTEAYYWLAIFDENVDPTGIRVVLVTCQFIKLNGSQVPILTQLDQLISSYKTAFSHKQCTLRSSLVKGVHCVLVTKSYRDFTACVHVYQIWQITSRVNAMRYTLRPHPVCRNLCIGSLRFRAVAFDTCAAVFAIVM